MLNINKSLLATTALIAVSLISAGARAEVPSQFVKAVTATTYTVLQSDCSKMVTFSNAAAVAVTLPQAGTAGAFFNGCFIDFENKGVGTVTITPTTSTINGGSTYVLTTNQGVHVASDSTNYQTQVGSGIAFGTAGCTSTSGGQCNGLRGVVTTSSLSITKSGGQAIAFTDNVVGLTSIVLCTLGAYSGTLNTNGVPTITQCTPTAGVITATVGNLGSTSLSGTVAIQFAVLN